MEEVEKVRVLVCGDSEVGKKSLTGRFTSAGGARKSTLSTIGVDVQHRIIRVREKNVKLQIWTTAGQERFRSLPARSYGRADGVVLVYDATRKETLHSVKQWLTDITENTMNRDIKIALVGNKIDLALSKTAANYCSGRALAASCGILFFESSAETGENVQELFEALATEVLDQRHHQRDSNGTEQELEQVDSITVEREMPSTRKQSQRWLCRNHC